MLFWRADDRRSRDGLPRADLHWDNASMYLGDRDLKLRTELQHAAADHLVVEIVYSGGTSPYGPRRIEVYEVDETYCRAFCLLRRAPRTFRLDRIVGMAVTEERFSVRPRTDLKWSMPGRPYGYRRSGGSGRVGAEGSAIRLVGALIVGFLILRGCVG